MSRIHSFAELHHRLSALPRRARIAICWPSDEHSLHAVLTAVEAGWAEALLVGQCHEATLQALAPEHRQWVEQIVAPDAETAIQQAVQLVHDGQADVLMKGMVNTDNLLRHILNKEYGLRPAGAVISHIAVYETPPIDRLLIISDVAVIPEPTLEQREAQIGYTTQIARSLGIDHPRAALLHFTEKVNEKFPLTLDYVTLKERCAAGQYGALTLDGPLDLLCAIHPEALEAKGLQSPLEGKADILLMPNIQAGNILYKALEFFPVRSDSASLLAGTSAPVVLTSRGDTTQAKVNSLALAALQMKH
ncbi:MAG: phosphate butyryltransferase [Bacteroidaceae bacterium]|nr:phosphate butyryltransferase [Bacteroidaceae bacterium]